MRTASVVFIKSRVDTRGYPDKLRPPWALLSRPDLLGSWTSSRTKNWRSHPTCLTHCHILIGNPARWRFTLPVALNFFTPSGCIFKMNKKIPSSHVVVTRGWSIYNKKKYMELIFHLLINRFKKTFVRGVNITIQSTVYHSSIYFFMVWWLVLEDTLIWWWDGEPLKISYLTMKKW